MSTAQHTPGPWKYGRQSVSPDWVIVTDAAGSIVANVNTETGPDAASRPAMRVMPADANARLIASAPELLAALEYVLNCAEADGWSEFMLGQARAAIAKAKGGAL